MEYYSKQTIETQIAAHKTAAMNFLELAESKDVLLNIMAKTENKIYRFSKIHQAKTESIFINFFYDLSHFHNDQKIRWEMIRDGLDPFATVEKIKK